MILDGSDSFHVLEAQRQKDVVNASNIHQLRIGTDRKCAIYRGILPVCSYVSGLRPSHEAAENYSFVPKGDFVRVIA